jgi:fido (protein-threonine AMPylation protein)
VTANQAQANRSLGAELLSTFEAIVTNRRGIEMEHKPYLVHSTRGISKAVHRYIFQDVFDWAGEFRTVNISKSGDPFAFHGHIALSLDKIFAELKVSASIIPASRQFFERLA